MATKKSVKKKVVKRKVVKRPARKVSKKVVARRPASTKKRIAVPKGIGSANPDSKFYHSKFNLILKNLGLFFTLFLVSSILAFFSTQPLYENLFMMLAILFFAITLAFVLMLLIFLFLRILKK